MAEPLTADEERVLQHGHLAAGVEQAFRQTLEGRIERHVTALVSAEWSGQLTEPMMRSRLAQIAECRAILAEWARERRRAQELRERVFAEGTS
jgi:hypothetical protein